MDITARVIRLEQRRQAAEPYFRPFTPKEIAAFDALFAQTERLNGPPPQNPDGTLSRDLIAAAEWLDAAPDLALVIRS